MSNLIDDRAQIDWSTFSEEIDETDDQTRNE